MKRLAALLCLALACFGIGKAALRRVPQENARLSRFVPAGPLIYLEAKDFFLSTARVELLQSEGSVDAKR